MWFTFKRALRSSNANSSNSCILLGCCWLLPVAIAFIMTQSAENVRAQDGACDDVLRIWKYSFLDLPSTGKMKTIYF